MRISILSHSVVTPLGTGSTANFLAIQEGRSGVALIEKPMWSNSPFYGSCMENTRQLAGFTRFESLAIESARDAMQACTADIDYRKTAFVLATTKGNVELLDTTGYTENELLLHHSAKKIATHLSIEKSFVVSNACTSGVMAVMFGKQLLEAGSFQHVIITGTDVLSRFVISGFQSLYALSDEPCKPFDATRKGLNLGEASATLILSSAYKTDYTISGSAATNDANHISGPSRTGHELSAAITSALSSAQCPVDFICAHGTATLYNDEMEAKAFQHANVSDLPVNSLKAYFGHTLGTAGLLEIIMSLQSLKHQELIASKGYQAHGVSVPLHIIQKKEKKAVSAFLKTASGFGGCNAAIVIGKL
ncbi:MAG TPA: beta-ketoacyl synthase N-terminal-like domain-containing protein [Cyclobacteriaceae bacterium]|nr:beta-ketoacyl synthase N-terminal-like domain-containing protein [Cyclobacteriaceae bacterium]